MPWLSIKQFKNRYLLGKDPEKVPVYEEFFSVRSYEGEVVLDAKKRYIRILIHPEDALVPISRKEASRMAKAIADRVEEMPKKTDGVVAKDGYYADFKDGQGVRVTVRQGDGDHVFIEARSIPHLRVRDSIELVTGLRTFAKKRGAS